MGQGAKLLADGAMTVNGEPSLGLFGQEIEKEAVLGELADEDSLDFRKGKGPSKLSPSVVAGDGVGGERVGVCVCAKEQEA